MDVDYEIKKKIKENIISNAIVTFPSLNLMLPIDSGLSMGSIKKLSAIASKEAKCY